ncbi:alpha/beta fold hydrolase [Brumimicrobium glaciale]|uniref:Alpha/beta fold hydrolase n=1 Tax=Brumimicrobium glaciale TaxID=200475 RepID=A0A4Q4KKB4_9FLAO|nr:alpha/beta fold hydrolase [Brumimicrobium glaciale]RYM33310.1 alpha/beta fold hydrolase [Brumimicrobium glaciale]
MQKLVLIHGAFGDYTEFDKIIPLLETEYEIEAFQIPHHGDYQVSKVEFEINALVKDFLKFLNKIGPAYVYGFSLGGYLAIAAAQKDETNFKGIITQGTKFDWSEESAKRETANMNVEFLSTKAEGFYNYLDQLHGDYLPELLKKTTDFMTKLGKNPLISQKSVEKITIPVRLTRGGKDKMVSKDETLNINEGLQFGNNFEIPSLIHPLGFIPPKHIARLISIHLDSLKYQWASTPFGKMAYEIIGEIQSETETVVLFLHEAIGSIAQWQKFPKHLCSELNLPGIAIEFPGYGFSESEDKIRDAKYLHEFALDYLPAFIEAIQLKNPLLIVGHSDGGTNALLYSAKYPSNVKGIVTMAAHYINEEETKAGIQPAIDAWKAGKLKGLEFFHGEKTERLFFAWANTWLKPDFNEWDISEDIKGNSVPALIIQGSNDQYGTDQQVNGIVDLLENAEGCFIEDCGHAPHLEKEGVVIAKINDFWLGIYT